MKIGMVLVLLMVLATAYLIGRAVRRSIKGRQAQREAIARQDARWTVFADPEEGEIRVGVQKVAELPGGFREVLDSEITARVSCDLPRDDRDMEVRIAKGDARAYADTLNDTV